VCPQSPAERGRERNGGAEAGDPSSDDDHTHEDDDSGGGTWSATHDALDLERSGRQRRSHLMATDAAGGVRR
jgi:hypothetical protein